MQIADWHEAFLSKFDPEAYVNLLSETNVASTIFFANSHTGKCNWPSQYAEMHRGFQGRDVLGEILTLCYQRGINVILYYSLIFNNWAYDNHPDWRMISADGEEFRWLNQRFGVCCPNSPYRDFATSQIKELYDQHSFDSVIFDMNFWPTVCYCQHCLERYRTEVGEVPPKFVNWKDPQWVRFQRMREAWLTEFASITYSTVKQTRPDATVRQNSTFALMNWLSGTTTAWAQQGDLLCGDFYADPMPEDLCGVSFFGKLFHNLTPNMPIEVWTLPVMPILQTPTQSDSTTLKPEGLLYAELDAVLAHHGAQVFVLPIEPVGNIDERISSKMGEVFRQTAQYEQYLEGRLIQDVGVYFCLESKVDLSDNGKSVTNFSSFGGNHLQGPLCVVRSLLNAHIPFGVITRNNLKEVSSFQIIVLPNLLMIDREEIEVFKDFVASGGALYASKYTSLLTKDGQSLKDFLLSDLFGVSYVSETKEELTFLSPIEERDLFLGYSNLSVLGSQLIVKANEDARILATITLPYTDPKDPRRFSFIYGNPPGIPTNYPSIVLNTYGKGKVLYVSGDLESVEHQDHRTVFINLLKLIAPQPFSFQLQAPKSVEAVVFYQEESERYLIHLLNFQAELPNIPVRGIFLKLKMDNHKPRRVIKLPEEVEIPFDFQDGNVKFEVPLLETSLMLAIDFD
jgi:hypothetical protein